MRLEAQSDETLDILIFGHSYGVDCTEHLPKLIDAAGLKTVRVARFVKGNCSMEERYKFFKDDWSKGYEECEPGQTAWVKRPCTFKEAIDARKWDYVIFQNSLENQGNYEKAQPYLNEMADYVRKTSMKKFGAEPKICWNMFWPISPIMICTQNARGAYRLSLYENNPEVMFAKYMQATKDLMADTGITNIIPSGTAIMNLRSSYLNMPEVYEFTRDGYHLSYGAGRYAAACVFFEYFVSPYSGISVVGNPLRLPDLKTPVTDKNAEFIQKCAAEAVKNPFVVNSEIGPKPKAHRKLIGRLEEADINRLGKVGYTQDFVKAFANMQAAGMTLLEQLDETDVVMCKNTLRHIVKDKAEKIVPDVLNYESFAMNKAYNSLRNILVLDKLLKSPCALDEVTSNKKDAYMCGFKDKKTGVVSVVMWKGDNKKAGKSELAACAKLSFASKAYKEPVAVDLRTGAVYTLLVKDNDIMEIPYYDSPVVVTEKELVCCENYLSFL